MTADAPMWQFGPMRDVLADHGVRADPRAVADLRGRVHDRTGIDVGPVGNQAEQQLAFSDELIADIRGGLRARQRRPARPQRDFEPQPIARDDRLAEFRVVDAAQIDAGPGSGIFALQQQDRRDL